MGDRVIPARRTSHPVQPAMCCRSAIARRAARSRRLQDGGGKELGRSCFRAFLLARGRHHIHRQLARFTGRHQTRRLQAPSLSCAVPCVARTVANSRFVFFCSVKSRSFFARNVAAPPSLFGLRKGCWPLYPRSTALEALSNILAFDTRKPHLCLGNTGVSEIRGEIVPSRRQASRALQSSNAAYLCPPPAL